MSKAWAFFRRDYIIATSYRTAFLFQLASIAVLVLVCYFTGKGVSLDENASFHKYGGFFGFILVGLGLLGYHSISLQTFNQSIRESQLMGTLEIVLLSPTSVTQLLVYSSLWIYTFVTIRFAAYLGFGAMLGFDLSSCNFLSVVAILALAVPAFASLGIASAALVLVIKRGEAISLMFATGSLVLGGVMFPIEKLPLWLHPISRLLPITHALEAMRPAISEGASVVTLAPQLGALALFSFIVLPLSLGLFFLAVRATKASGTLSQY